MKKLLSLALVALMSLTLCIPAFASDVEVNENERIYDLGNGIIAIVGVVEDDSPMLTRAVETVSDTASASMKSYSYTLSVNDGNCCDSRVWNTATSGSGSVIQVSFSGDFNGTPFSISPETVAAGSRAYIQIKDTSGTGLTGEVITSIQSSNGELVPYTYTFEQWWD